MVSYIIRRLLLLLLCLVGVVSLIFLLVRVMPGDAARALAGRSASPEAVAMIRDTLGLDDPLWRQYIQYMGNTLTLDFGRSMISREPIIDEIIRYFPPTFELVTVSLLITTILGVTFGVISAVRKDRLADNLIRIVSMSGVSMPIFWLAILLQLALASTLRILPVEGRLTIDLVLANPIPHITGLYTVDAFITGHWAALGDALKHLLLPAFCVSYGELALVTRLTRASMLETLHQDYVRTARAYGFRESIVILKYTLRNALVPVVTILGMSYGFLLGGSVLVETVFSWPGLGRYVVNSIFARDTPAIIGVVVLTAFIVMFLNLLVDIAYLFIDPRIEYG